jgi:hypothetical protein
LLVPGFIITHLKFSIIKTSIAVTHRKISWICSDLISKSIS